MQQVKTLSNYELRIRLVLQMARAENPNDPIFNYSTPLGTA
ncbi:hypothetical protein [Nostoc sp. UHCC 0252]|nr:hypothetical protein [Nostoc sp. UHCC 0252]MEA5603377.1 hypothetical protein [Nostoc sp. UHCC 0252]